MNEIKEMVQKLALQMTSLNSRQYRHALQFSSQRGEIKYPWETKRNLDDHTCLVTEKVKKKEIEQRNCPLTSEKLEALVAVVNNNDSSPAAAETATTRVFDVEFGKDTEDPELAVLFPLSMDEEGLKQENREKQLTYEDIAVIENVNTTFEHENKAIDLKEDANAESETEQYEPIGERKECTTSELEPVLKTPNIFGEASSVSSSTNCISEVTTLPSDEYQVMNMEVKVLSHAKLIGVGKDRPSILKPSDLFTFTSLQKITKGVEEPWREYDEGKAEVENHLEYLLSRLLMGKCTVKKACELAIQKAVKHFSPELFKGLSGILFLDPMSHEQLRQTGCYKFYHVEPGIVVANERY